LAAGLQILQSLSLIGLGIYQLIQYGWPPPEQPAQPAGILQWLRIELATSSLGLIIFGGITLLISLALLRLKNWAWLTSMSIQGWMLLAALIAYARNHPNYLMMVLGVVVVLYLNQQDVQAAFRRKPGEEI